MQTATKPRPEQRSSPYRASGRGLRMLGAEPGIGASAGMPAFLQRKGGINKSHGAMMDSSEEEDQPRSDQEESPISIQKKLLIGAVDDPLEHEADRVSEIAATSDQVRRETVASSHRASVGTATLPGVDAGSSLADSVRRQVEPVLGADLASVRVHTGAEAADAAQAIDARAFTHKNHIWLGANESPDNTELLAHEATHVVHQSDGVGPGSAVNPNPAPAIQRTPHDPSSSAVATPESATHFECVPTPEGISAAPEAMTTPTGDETDASSSRVSEGSGGAGGADTGTSADAGGGGAEGSGPSGTSGPQADGDGSGGETGGSMTESAEEDIGGAATAPVVPETGAGNLGTGDLALIDVELAEHQRWAGALGHVGETASVQRAEFIVDAVGSGFLSGGASGLAMGLSMGLATRAVPALGPLLGGGMALHGLITRDWAATDAAIGRFGEGGDVYETLANSIASVSAMIDVASGVLNVINGIVGIVQIAALALTAGATVATVLTLGAAAPVAIEAGSVLAECIEISEGITVVTTALDQINAQTLQPSITLFRALHAFTTQGDPREVEAQGREISTAAAASGAALGAWAGGEAANAKGQGKPPTQEEPPPTQQSPHETPPPATGDGPAVHSVGPAAHPDAAPPPAAQADTVAAPAAPAVADPLPSAAAAPADVTPTPATAPAAPQEQLTLPHTQGPGSELRPLTAPLELAGIKGNEPIPQGLAPGSIGTYNRAVANPHEAALASNPPGEPGATAGGGRMPKGPDAAGVYLEHQTSASAANEVLPGHEYLGPQGQKRGGRDVKDALVIALPKSVKNTKDAADTALRTEIRARIANGEDVAPIEVIARSAQITQDAIAQDGATVPPTQVSRNFLAEVDQFNDPRFGYQEVRPGDPLPAGHPLADASPAELDAFVNRTFDPFITPADPGATPPAAPPPVQPAPDTNQTSFDFGPGTATTPPPQSTPLDAPPPVTGPAVTPAPVTPPPVSSAAQEGVQPTATSATAPTPTAATPVAPTATTSDMAGPMGAATRAARDAPRTLGGPQPGTDSPTWGTRAHQVGELFLPQVFGGDAPTYAQQQAAHRARFTADNQPAEDVERVNPNYPPPPATPAQIDAIKDEIVALLGARAQAEQAAQHQSERAAVCDANSGPIEQTVQDTAGGISAVQAHDEAVARHEAVTQEQQQRHAESQGLVAGYPSRAAGLAALSGPLAAWAGFTSLASHLPGEAGASMLRMNQEAEQMQASFAQMGAQMAGVDSGGPDREAELDGNEERLAATSEQAASSGEELQTASEGAAALQEANDAAHTEATDASLTCTEQAQEHGDAAAAREEQADTLAEQLRAWASAHAQARQQAIAATEQRLESEGRTVVRSSEQ
jgi:hypothetical protein